jgi:hypothetical protein
MKMLAKTGRYSNFFLIFNVVMEEGFEASGAEAADFDSAIRRFESSRPSQPSWLIPFEFLRLGFFCRCHSEPAFRCPHLFGVSDSALPPKADMCSTLTNVRFWPQADISTLRGIDASQNWLDELNGTKLF